MRLLIQVFLVAVAFVAVFSYTIPGDIAFLDKVDEIASLIKKHTHGEGFQDIFTQFSGFIFTDTLSESSTSLHELILILKAAEDDVQTAAAAHPLNACFNNLLNYWDQTVEACGYAISSCINDYTSFVMNPGYLTGLKAIQSEFDRLPAILLQVLTEKSTAGASATIRLTDGDLSDFITENSVFFFAWFDSYKSITSCIGDLQSSNQIGYQIIQSQFEVCRTFNASAVIE